jgi:hypothetical protein
VFLLSRSKSGVGQGWRSLQTHTCNRPRPNPRERDLIESRIVSRRRRSRRGRWIRPLLLRHRLQGAEFFPASSPTSRCVVRSETPHQPRQSLTLLRGRQGDHRCRRRKAKIKHRGCPGTRASRPPRVRRWRRDCRPRRVTRPACNQMKGQAFRPGSRRPRKSNLSAVWRRARRQSEETNWRSLATTSGSVVGLAGSDPR